MEPRKEPAAACPSCGAELEGDLSACFSCGHARGSAALRRGQVISGRYELTGVLGRGGMGTVYRARDRSLGEPVALKVLSETARDSADADRRFRAEIRLARKVRHPNVCAIHEYGELEDLQYIVMELVDGQDLKKYLQSRGTLTTAEAVDIAREIGEGLQAIHDAGVIHRDLKLANVMRDTAGRLRLMDFGIAKSAGDMMSTVTGHILGTPEYMSPEQVQGQPVDTRADIYSLGIMTYELLTGRVPFVADTPLAVIMMQVHQPPRLEDPAISPAMAEALGRALAKKPVDRFESARAFVTALMAARDSPGGALAEGRGLPSAPTQSLGEKASLGRGRAARSWLPWVGATAAALAGVGASAWLSTRSSETMDQEPRSSLSPKASATKRSVVSSPPPSPSLPEPPAPTPSASPERAVRVATQKPARSSTAPSALAPIPRETLSQAPSPGALAVPTLPQPITPTPAPASMPAATAARGATPAILLPATGYLELGATPFAQVIIDGKDGGLISGSRRLELNAGRHEIRFLHPAYQPLQRIITIRPGETRHLFVDLVLDGIAK